MMRTAPARDRGQLSDSAKNVFRPPRWRNDMIDLELSMCREQAILASIAGTKADRQSHERCARVMACLLREPQEDRLR